MIDLANLCLWGGIAWMMFARALRLDHETKLAIVLGISGVGTVSIAKAIAPFVPGWEHSVHPIDLFLSLALFVLFAAFAPTWAHGPPPGISREGKAERLRDR